MPVTPPGTLSILQDVVLGSGNGAKRRVDLEVVGLTGAPGTLTFSAPITIFQSENLTCGSTSCTLGGVVAPDVVTLDMETQGTAPVTIELLDSAGAVVDSYTSP